MYTQLLFDEFDANIMLIVLLIYICRLARAQEVPVEKFLRIPRAVTEETLQEIVRYLSFCYPPEHKREN
jgi:hypothetical protein